MSVGIAAHATCLRVLQATWRTENHARFGGTLRPCILDVVAMSGWGRWDLAARTLSLSTRLVACGDWLAIREVLLHEMAHQYVTEVLKAPESAHGPVFRAVCAERGIDPRAMRTLEQIPTSNVVRRIGKLLQLSGSSERHEAEAALRTALRLLAREGLCLDDLSDGPDVRVAAWGAPRSRWPAHLRVLVARLAGVFGVEALLVPAPCLRTGRSQTAMEVLGPVSALELFLHTADCVSAAAERAWSQARHALGPTARRGFLLGVVQGFLDTLSPEVPALQEAGLIPIDGAVAQAWRARRYPRLRRTRVTAAEDAAWRQGVAVGKAIRVHPAVPGATSGDRRALVDTRSQSR